MYSKHRDLCDALIVLGLILVPASLLIIPGLLGLYS